MKEQPVNLVYMFHIELPNLIKSIRLYRELKLKYNSRLDVLWEVRS